METFKQTIEIDLPISTVYNQWTQFEEFPKFMEGVSSVRQIDDKHLHWKARIAGKDVQWDAEIYEQRPDEIIGWRSIAGEKNVGSVTFMPLEGDKTIIVLKLAIEPEGIIQKTAVASGMVSRYLEDNLKRFKKFIEDRQKETGAWREEIETPASGKPHVQHVH